MREYYLTYHAMGVGLSPAKTNSDIAIGIARHDGVDALFSGEGVDAAVQRALLRYSDDTAAGIAGFEDHYAVQAAQREHRTIIEAGLRVWAFKRLPVLLSSYDVLAVETERSCAWEVSISDAYDNVTTTKVVFEGRIDAELKSKADGKVYAFSLKNPREYNAKRHPDCNIDMQGKSETWLVGNTYGHEWAGGVLMEYIMAGQEKDDKWAPDKFSGDAAGSAVMGTKIRWTPFARGWQRPQEAGGMEYAWMFKYPNPLYNPAMEADNYRNPANKTFTKSTRVAAWEYPGGVKAWVDDLLAQKFVPREVDPLVGDALMFAPAPYYRQPGAITSWLYSTVERSEMVVRALSNLSSGKKNIDQAFPMSETSCMNKYGSRCAMWGICHEGKGDDPLNKGYKLREPHHEKEKLALLSGGVQ
jgi:hypothetical protein